MTWTEAAVWLLLFSVPCQPNDVDRFPPDVHVWETNTGTESEYLTWRVSEDREEWLRAQRGWAWNDIETYYDWDRQLEEQDDIRRTWYMLTIARWYRKNHCPDMAVTKLEELRERIGFGAYTRGEMPNPLPLHRYTDITPQSPRRAR